MRSTSSTYRSSFGDRAGWTSASSPRPGYAGRVYGQRYDNGQRHDGVDTRTLPYEDKPTKGPDTIWDAPGMVRIKIPWGRMTIDQMEILAEVAEDYSDGILHVTTRQDFQLHFVHIDDTPDLMRRAGRRGDHYP